MPALLPILSLLKNPWILLLIACAIGAAGTGWYKMRHEGCVAARAEDRAAAEKARSEALEHARDTSDRIIAEQAQALAQTASKAQTVTERIIRVPVTTACAGAPAVVDALGSLRGLLDSGGGEAPAERGPAPAVR